MRAIRPAEILLMGVLALALRLAASWLIPLGSGTPDPNCAPDEGSHFEIVAGLVEGRALVFPRDTQSPYGCFPPVPYLVHAGALALGRIGADPDALVRHPAREPRYRGYGLARLGSVGLGVLTVLLLAAAAARWTGSRRCGVVAGLVATLYPQAIFLSAYNNADSYTLAAGALFLFALARWARAGEGDAGLGLLGAAAGFVLTGKLSGFFLLPTTALWVGWAVLQRRARPIAALGAVATALAVAGPPLLWHALHTGADPFGLTLYRQWRDAYPAAAVTGAEVSGAAGKFVRWLAISSFARFRNMDLGLPPLLYGLFALFWVGGIAVALRGIGAESQRTRRGAFWLGATVVLNLALVAWNCWSVSFSPQGRYVLLSALTTSGIAAWAPLRAGGRGRIWTAAFLGFLAVAALSSLAVLWTNPCLPTT